MVHGAEFPATVEVGMPKTSRGALKMCGAVFSLVCVSAMAYAGMPRRVEVVPSSLRRLATCPTDCYISRGAVFSLVCVSAMAYAGMPRRVEVVPSSLRRLATCPTDKKQCPGGWEVLRIPDQGCQFAACPLASGGGGGSVASPSAPAAAPAAAAPAAAAPAAASAAAPADTATAPPGTTMSPKTIVEIAAGTIAGAAVVGGIIAGAVAFSQHELGNAKLTVSRPVTQRLYSQTDGIKPVAATGHVSQGVLAGIAAFGFFAFVFLAITGVVYIYKKNRSVQSPERSSPAAQE